MPVVWIPPLVRDLTGGQQAVSVPGTTVCELVQNLDAMYPGIKARLCDGDSLRPGLAVAVDSVHARAGLAERVGEDSEVHFLPAIAGGSD
jgi:molybdopterin synthase sulfur carrier subunit